MVKRLIWTLLAVLLVATACSKDAGFEMGISGADSASRSSSERGYSMPSRRVMVMISAGYNSLSGYLSEDLKDLESGYLPEGTYFNADVLLVLARLPKSAGDYASPSAPVLYRLWANRSGEVQRDTIQVWGGDTQLCTRETIHEAPKVTAWSSPRTAQVGCRPGITRTRPSLNPLPARCGACVPSARIKHPPVARKCPWKTLPMPFPCTWIIA